MVNGLINYFKELFSGVNKGYEFLLSTPFEDIPGMEHFTPLMLIGFGGLALFVVIAIVKWAVS